MWFPVLWAMYDARRGQERRYCDRQWTGLLPDDVISVDRCVIAEHLQKSALVDLWPGRAAAMPFRAS